MNHPPGHGPGLISLLTGITYGCIAVISAIHLQTIAAIVASIIAAIASIFAALYYGEAWIEKRRSRKYNQIKPKSNSL